LFWQDNASKLEENDLELLKILTKLLAQSRDPTVLSIAAYDLGEYVKNRPMGRMYACTNFALYSVCRYFEDLGTKQQLMHLMAHQNSDVRFNALNSVQKYMSNLWY
jgi:V-type H+-transporting ATPase subunit H